MSCCYDLLVECGLVDEEKKEDELEMNYELKSIKPKKKIKKVDQSTQTTETTLNKIKHKKKKVKEPGT
jgi:hypothetical protein